MKSIHEVQNSMLQWHQPDVLKREYELVSGEDVVAALRWETCSGTLAVAESSEGQCSLKREGFLHPKVTIRPTGSDANTAMLYMGADGDGTLHFVEGPAYDWRYMNFWQTEWCFASQTGELLARFSCYESLISGGATIALTNQGVDLPEITLLAIIGWYVMVLMAEDLSGAVAAEPAPMAI